MTSAEILLKWRRDPVAFVREVFKVEPDAWQVKALQAFASNDPISQRIALKACAGPGKSTVLAWCGWNFLVCYSEPGNHPKAAVVSVTESNLKDNLWSELSKWHDRSNLLKNQFTWTQTRIFHTQNPSTWFMSARSFAKSANTEEVGRTLSGLHSKYILYLIDESGDIPPSIAKSAEQGLSTKPAFGKILQAGNPTSHDGMLYHVATKLRDQWTVITITGDPDDPNRSPRIDAEWARKQIETYGRDNPWVKAYILGEFPDGSINTLLTIDDVEKSINRHLREQDYEFSQKRLGVDVARYGTDFSVIFPRQGRRAFKPVKLSGLSSNELAARVMMAKNKWGSEAEFIDGTGGFGSGVVDSLKQAGVTAHEIHFSSRAIDQKSYLNRRAEMWFSMANWVKSGGVLPNDPELIQELTSVQYTFTNGKFQIEPKDNVKERIGRSTDLSDALCLTFALPDQASNEAMKSNPLLYKNQSIGKLKVDYEYGE